MKNKLLLLSILLAFIAGNTKLKAQGGGDAYLGQMLYVAFTFAPVGWADCNGQLMSINENSALYSLIGTTYGGDGVTTFALPNVQSRVLIGDGTSTTSGANYVLGQSAGTEKETLTINQMPMHNHQITAVNGVGSQNLPTNALPSDSQVLDKKYSTSGTLAPMSNLSVKTAGGNQPHDNIQPYITFKCIIATQGIYPSQN